MLPLKSVLPPIVAAAEAQEEERHAWAARLLATKQGRGEAVDAAQKDLQIALDAAKQEASQREAEQVSRQLQQEQEQEHEQEQEANAAQAKKNIDQDEAKADEGQDRIVVWVRHCGVAEMLGGGFGNYFTKLIWSGSLGFGK